MTTDQAVRLCLTLLLCNPLLAQHTASAQAKPPAVEALVVMNYYTVEPTSDVVFIFNEPWPEDTRVRAVLSPSAGPSVAVEAAAGAADVATLRLPIKDLSVGRYPVALSVLADGNVVWQGSDTLVKRPPADQGVRIVQVDRFRGIMVVDGEPWFAMGVFGIFPEHLQEAADAGFNVTMRWKGATTMTRYDRGKAWNDPANRGAVRDYLDRVQQAGMLAIEAPVKLVERSLYVKYRDPHFHDKFPIVNHEITPGVVRNAHDHPAVIGYYNYDEPDNFYPDQPDHPNHLLMQRGVEDWYDVVQQMDPYHPVMTLFAVGLSKVDRWKAWDVALRDFYVHTDQHMGKVYETAVDSVKVAQRLHTPFVYTPLFEKSSGRPVPLSPAEQRAQTYLSIVADVKGLFYWDWPAAYTPNWKMLKQLAGEVNQLAPVLLERAPRQRVTHRNPGTETAVRALVKNHHGDTYLIAVNAEPAFVSVVYQLPQSYQGGAELMFEDRSVDVRQGGFSDSLEPYGRRVYRLRGQQWDASSELTLTIEVGPEVKAPEPMLVPSDEDLIVNGSFEHDEAALPGWPYRWSTADTIMESGVTGERGRWSVDENLAQDGQRSMRLIKIAAGIGNSDDAFNLGTAPAVHQQVKFPSPDKYTLSAWLKGDRPVRTWMMVGWGKSVPIDVGTDWQRYEMTIDRNSAGDDFVRIYLMQQGTLWIDNVKLQPQ